MRLTEPKVRLIAYPQIDWDPIYSHLNDVGGLDWFTRMRKLYVDGQAPSDAEILIEYAGRRCYKSWAPGINPNVTKVRQDSAAYLANVLDSRHGSVLEHAQFTFDFDNVSRVFTHELVRHRAGVAISQESMRYVRLSDIGFWMSPELDRDDVLMPMKWHQGDDDLSPPTLVETVVTVVEMLEEFQRDAADALGLDGDGIPFAEKKKITSALRRLAPDGVSTGMVWSANIRTIRFVIEQRTDFAAEEEIRMVFHGVAMIMRSKCPLLFSDYELRYTDDKDETHEFPMWVPETRKV